MKIMGLKPVKFPEKTNPLSYASADADVTEAATGDTFAWPLISNKKLSDFEATNTVHYSKICPTMIEKH